MKLSMRLRFEAVLGLGARNAYMDIKMGSCDPRSRRNTEVPAWTKIGSCNPFKLQKYHGSSRQQDGELGRALEF